MWAFQRQQIMALTSLDLSAAFDTVDHEVLLQMLSDKFGITDQALHWFEEYLQSRSFKVLINNSFSKEISLKYSMPQGSAAGANIFNLYCSTLSKIIPSDLHLSGFAEDHSVRRKFNTNNRNDERNTMASLESCMLTIKSWMDTVHLKMNPSKTEFILFSNQVQLNKCTTNDININGDLIARSHAVRYLGAWLDSNLSYKLHITKKCQAAMLNFQRIKSIQHLLDPSTCANLCVSLCISHLDYANSLLTGLPKVSLNKLQRVQNMCAKLALREGKFDSPRECMKHLHWLLIRYRINFKILVLTHKCLNGDAPEYLKDLIVILQPTREGLHSGSTTRLLIPKTKYKTFTVCSFSVAAPMLWNSMPENLRLIKDIDKFKTEVKTYLFRQAYNT